MHGRIAALNAAGRRRRTSIPERAFCDDGVETSIHLASHGDGGKPAPIAALFLGESRQRDVGGKPWSLRPVTPELDPCSAGRSVLRATTNVARAQAGSRDDSAVGYIAALPPDGTLGPLVTWRLRKRVGNCRDEKTVTATFPPIWTPPAGRSWRTPGYWTSLTNTYNATIARCRGAGLYVGHVPGLPSAQSRGQTLEERNANLRTRWLQLRHFR